MPSVSTDKVKKKFFPFNSLLLKNNAKNTANRKNCGGGSSYLGENNTKMFLSESLSKLNSFSSRTLHSGYLKSKTLHSDSKVSDIECSILILP